MHDTVVDDEDTERADVVIAIRELDDVLMKDVGDKIAASGKWVPGTVLLLIWSVTMQYHQLLRHQFDLTSRIKYPPL